jgi:pimeloyl-ACP methyl ester carboxylesterase
MYRGGMQRLPRVVALLLAALATLAGGWMGGCAGGAYARLHSETQVPELAALAQEGRGLGTHTALVPTRGLSGRPMSLAVHEVTGPGRERVLVLLHGILADSRTWRFVIAGLAKEADLVLVDLPGCGQSELPGPSTPESEFELGAIGARVLEAVEARLAARRSDGAPEPRIGIVAHSLGGAIALRMFCDPEVAGAHGATLKLVDRIVLVSPLDVAIGRQDPVLRKIAEVSGAEVAVASASGYMKRRVGEAIEGSVCDPGRALREEADIRIEYLTESGRRRACQAMLRRAIPWRGGRPDWNAIEPVEDEYCHIDIPAMIVWGRRDETLPIAMGYKLAAQLPRATLKGLPGVMHSPHIEAPGTLTGLIADFLREPRAMGR